MRDNLINANNPDGEKWTALDVWDAAQAVVAEKGPDTKNPLRAADGTCLYEDERDPDRHCIAGQIIISFNLPVELVEDTNADQLPGIDAVFTERGAHMLQAIQTEADGYHGTPWGQALDRSRQQVDSWLQQSSAF